MSNVFITSDEHIGHQRILTLVPRPFKTVEENREIIIERHNKKVPNSPGYLTVHVGDMMWHTLTVEEATQYINRLHGKHALIYGNHDQRIEESPELQKLFVWIVGKDKDSGTKILHWNKQTLVVCHYAMRVWHRSHRGSWHVYGHSHNALPGLGKSFDIGVDGHNYEPWSMEEIEAKMNTLTQHHTIDNTGKGMCDRVDHYALAS